MCHNSNVDLCAKAEFRRRHAEARARSAERQREMSAQEFRLNLARKNRSRQTESDLYTSQKTCHQLDTVKGWTEPVEVSKQRCPSCAKFRLIPSIFGTTSMEKTDERRGTPNQSKGRIATWFGGLSPLWGGGSLRHLSPSAEPP